MEQHAKCPNCGRKLTEDEIYCYFCELDIKKLNAKAQNHKKIKKSKK